MLQNLLPDYIKNLHIIQQEISCDILEGKVILVLGAGGSIGSALCKKLGELKVKKLILLDRDETNLYLLKQQMDSYDENNKFVFLIGDIQNIFLMDEIFNNYKPQIIFHTAAYKHLTITQQNPKEAFLVNTASTLKICQYLNKYQNTKLVHISTDKATAPISVLGITKRLAEVCVDSFGNNTANVRFVNVVGSRGSVLFIFANQIKEGKPLTVTHPDIERYFMQMQDAISLIILSLYFSGGIVMPIVEKSFKILDIAYDMIKKANKIPYKDIQIRFIGLREGERLKELPLPHKGQNTHFENVSFVKSQIQDSDFIKSIEKLALKCSRRQIKDDELKIIFNRLLEEYQIT